MSVLRWGDVADGDAILVTVPPRQDEPGGRDEGRAVREGRRRPRPPDAQGRHEPGAGWTRSCRSRRRWWGCGLRAGVSCAEV